MICRIIVETPTNLNHDQKELLKQFGAALDKTKNSGESKKGFFDKLKDGLDDLF